MQMLATLIKHNTICIHISHAALSLTLSTLTLMQRLSRGLKFLSYKLQVLTEANLT